MEVFDKIFNIGFVIDCVWENVYRWYYEFINNIF